MNLISAGSISLYSTFKIIAWKTNLHMCAFFQYERMVLWTFLSSVSTTLQTLSVTYSPPSPSGTGKPSPSRGVYRGGPTRHGPFWPGPPSPAGRDQLTLPAIPCRPRPVDPARLTTYTPVVTKLTAAESVYVRRPTLQQLSLIWAVLFITKNSEQNILW